MKWEFIAQLIAGKTPRNKAKANKQALAPRSTTHARGQTFTKFQEFPLEIRRMIWNAAARPLDPTSGDIHYFDGAAPEGRFRRRPEARPAKIAHASEITSLWMVNHESRNEMMFRYRTPEFYRDHPKIPIPDEDELNERSGGWKWVDLKIPRQMAMFVRPRKDLFIFQPALTPRFTKRHPPSILVNAQETFAYNFHQPLGNEVVTKGGAKHVAFYIDEAMERWIIPSWSRAVVTLLWSFQLETGAVVANLSKSKDKQIWFMDPALHTPYGWIAPAGRKHFHGDGFDLVEVELKDYGAEPSNAKRLFDRFWWSREEQLDHHETFDPDPIRRGEWGDVTDQATIDANPHKIRCASKEVMAFQLASALERICQTKTPPSFSSTPRNITDIRILARADLPGKIGRKQHRPQRAEEFMRIYHDFFAEKTAVKVTEEAYPAGEIGSGTDVADDLMLLDLAEDEGDNKHVKIWDE